MHLPTCNIQSIHDDAFRSLTRLQDLILSGNELRIDNGFSSHSFTHIPYLKFLDLSSNPLGEIPPLFFNDLPNLRNLELDHVRNIRLRKSSLSGMVDLQHISLASNRLETISKWVFNGKLERLQKLDLSDNPLICDCCLLWLWDYVRVLGRAQCSSSQTLFSFLHDSKKKCKDKLTG